VISVPKAVVILACAATSLARPASAQVGVTEPMMVIVTVAAPIFAVAYESKMPMQVAKVGSRLKVLDATPGWYHVEFKDPQLGRQTGFIQIQNVGPAPADYRRKQPVEIEPAAAAIQQWRTLQAPRKSYSSKFFVGIGAEGNGIVTGPSGGSTTSDSGKGVGFVVGYGFSPLWSLYSDISGASINATGGGTYSLTHVDIGTRVHFLAGTHKAGTQKVVPFVQAGLSGRAMRQDVGTDTATASGAGVAFGGGLNVHFTPALAFSTAVAWSVGDFGNFTRGNQTVSGIALSATTARIHAGVIWFPQASSR
jgi:hypothetical protein